MKFNLLSILFIMALLCSCDDSTPGIGETTIPDDDRIESATEDYKVTTKSLLVDSVYARTSTAYLGRYTDPAFGEFTSDFMTQFTCTDDFEFPETIQDINDIKLFMQYSGFFGDSLAIMKLQIDTLNKVIPELSKANFYTSIDPSEFCNKSAKPIYSSSYSAGGASVDTIFSSSSVKIYNQTLMLPKSLGQYMIDKYKQDKNNYKDAEKFINNVLKGFYVHCTGGDGSILYINNLDLRLTFSYLIESSTGKIDSLVNGYVDFAATKEVIQANHFTNSEKIKELSEEEGYTYIKTPAGIVTEATLPMLDIEQEHAKDTLNSASITFKRYNDTNDSEYKMGIPSYLLMIRKSELYSFFEQNKLPDSKTSFIASKGSTTATQNEYTFSNIARLITTCISEKNAGMASNPNWLDENPEWNKIVLVPVNVEYDSSSSSQSIINVTNSLEMQSIKLYGGKDNLLNMKLLYTKLK